MAKGIKGLPDELSDVAFIVLVELVPCERSRSDLEESLRQVGWNRTANALSVQLRRLHDDKYVEFAGAAKSRTYVLTKAGSQALRRRVQRLREYWHRYDKTFEFIERNEKHLPTVPALQRQRKDQRLPDKAEIAEILKHSPLGFEAIYKASIWAEVNVYQLAAADCAGFDFMNRQLLLPETTDSGTAITQRCCPLRRVQLADLVIKAVDGRKSGRLFRRKNGNRWSEATLLKTFKQTCRKAGLPESLVLVGRGGKVAPSE